MDATGRYEDDRFDSEYDASLEPTRSEMKGGWSAQEAEQIPHKYLLWLMRALSAAKTERTADLHTHRMFWAEVAMRFGEGRTDEEIDEAQRAKEAEERYEHQRYLAELRKEDGW